MIDMLPKETFRISICHIFAVEEAIALKTSLQSQFPNAQVSIDELGPVVGAHLGPQALGICYLY